MKRLITLALFFCALTAFAQKRIYFFKDNGKYVTNRDSADYIRIVSEPDSGTVLYNVTEFYQNNQKKLTGKSTAIEYFSPEGTVITYYRNGNKKSVGDYNKRYLTGPFYEFFPNGKAYRTLDYQIDAEKKKQNPGDSEDDYTILSCNDSTGKSLVTGGNGYYVSYDDDFKYINDEGGVKDGKRTGNWKGADHRPRVTFTEVYEDNVLKSGQSTDSAGNKHTYTNRKISPGYKGGIPAFGSYLSRHIKYPKDAMENDIQGKVLLSFTIKKDGSLSDIRVIKPLYPSIDAEAVRILASTKWQPGIYYGIPVSVKYNVPIVFAMPR
jgi:TonB family protein